MKYEDICTGDSNDIRVSCDHDTILVSEMYLCLQLLPDRCYCHDFESNPSDAQILEIFACLGGNDDRFHFEINRNASIVVSIQLSHNCPMYLSVPYCLQLALSQPSLQRIMFIYN